MGALIQSIRNQFKISSALRKAKAKLNDPSYKEPSLNAKWIELSAVIRRDEIERTEFLIKELNNAVRDHDFDGAREGLKMLGLRGQIPGKLVEAMQDADSFDSDLIDYVIQQFDAQENRSYEDSIISKRKVTMSFVERYPSDFLSEMMGADPIDKGIIRAITMKNTDPISPKEILDFADSLTHRNDYDEKIGLQGRFELASIECPDHDKRSAKLVELLERAVQENAIEDALKGLALLTKHYSDGLNVADRKGGIPFGFKLDLMKHNEGLVKAGGVAIFSEELLTEIGNLHTEQEQLSGLNDQRIENRKEALATLPERYPSAFGS